MNKKFINIANQKIYDKTKFFTIKGRNPLTDSSINIFIVSRNKLYFLYRTHNPYNMINSHSEKNDPYIQYKRIYITKCKNFKLLDVEYLTNSYTNIYNFFVLRFSVKIDGKKKILKFIPKNNYGHYKLFKR
jgi:hypothetical protein